MVVIGVPVDKDFTIDVRTAAYCSAEAMRPGVTWGYVASREAGVGRSTYRSCLPTIYQLLREFIRWMLMALCGRSRKMVGGEVLKTRLAMN